MKKYWIILLLMVSLLFVPMRTMAKEDAINIYLFRGKGCGFCQKFLNYVNDTLTEKYYGKFNLVSYEVWNNTKNNELLTKVRTFLGSEKTGVPFIVIGDKYFEGYTESYNTAIEQAIQDLYDSSNRYDVFEEINKSGDKIDLDDYTTKELNDVYNEEGIIAKEVKVSSYSASNGSNTVAIVLWDLLFTAFAMTIILVVQNQNKKAILEEISKIK